MNFHDPPAGGFPAPIADALQDATPHGAASTLRVVALVHLIVFKPYAGGPRSKSDVRELLGRHRSST